MEINGLRHLTNTTHSVTHARNMAIPPINPAISPGTRHVHMGASKPEVGRGILEPCSSNVRMGGKVGFPFPYTARVESIPRGLHRRQ